MTPPLPAKATARLVVDRYRLDRELARGEGGEVFCATDLVADREVALKLLPRAASAPRFRAEASALGLLRLPGVAALFDEGEHEGRPFLVLELARGEPFPGAGRSGWPELARPTIALLETLARVHDRGVVHRDLKPDNVFVDSEGRPTVLDFGLSSGPAIGSGAPDSDGAVGTLLYAAPEQLLGGRVDARADLFAFGVMVYEALTGHVPHTEQGPDGFVCSRLEVEIPSVRERAPDVPPRIAEWLSSLLRLAPEERPRSAAAALRGLRGEVVEERLPWLGSTELLKQAREELSCEGAVAFVGGRGAGKTRCLEAMADELERLGGQLFWLKPSDAALGSLVGFEPECASASLEATLLFAVRHVVAGFERGDVFLADDWESIDPWTRRVLRRALLDGAGSARSGWLLLSAQSAHAVGELPCKVLALEALSRADLEALFAGPERLFHLPQDGAHELWKRTRGVPGRVAAELASWERAGLVRWSDERLVIDRPALGRLALGLAVSPHDRVELRSTSSAEGSAEELLAWIALARGRAHTSWLAGALERPAWRVEAELDELVRRGAVTVRKDGTLFAELVPSAFDEWSPKQRQRAHARLALHLKPGAPGRLLHLILGGRPGAVPEEARWRARYLSSCARLAEAEAVLVVGLGVARQLGLERHIKELLAEWCTVALADFSCAALDRVLFELARERRLSPGGKQPELLHLSRLLEAGLATLRGAGRALDQVEEVAPFKDLELERWLQALCTQAARRAEPEREEAVVAALTERWGRHPSPLIQASLNEWRGRLAYRLGDYAAAVEFFADAAKRGPRVGLRLSAILNGASAALELGDFERASMLARRARGLARECRHLLFEVRSEWVLRAAIYRMGADEVTPDLELVDAAACIGVPDQEALIALNEAAVAWRVGHPGAAGLAGLAGSLWASQGKLTGALIARALQLAAMPTREVASEELEELLQEGLACEDPVLGAQVVALLVSAGLLLEDRGEELQRALKAVLAEGGPDPSLRREVLAPHEMLSALSSPGRR